MPVPVENLAQGESSIMTRTLKSNATSHSPQTAPSASSFKARAGSRFQGPAAVALATTALLAPFLDKAFHLDDTVFLRIARQIEEFPLEPYNFQYNWFYEPKSVWAITQHPPLHSYLLAAVGLVAGYSEPAMHLYAMALAVGCALLMYSLSRRFCREPTLAAMLTVLAPAFFVSAGTLMADVPMYFFWLLATYLAVQSAERGQGWLLWPAAIAAAAAAMTKYFGIAVTPLIVAYWIARQRRLSPHLLALAIPIAVLVLWGCYAKEQADIFHPLGAAGYAVKSKSLKALFDNSAFTLGFLGGGILWPVALVPAARRLPELMFALLGVFWVAILILGLTQYPLQIAIVFGLFVLGGCFLVGAAIESCLLRRDADTVLLGLWFFGTTAFAAFLNWTVNARVILPAIFPATVLTLRWLETLETRDFWLKWASIAAWPVLVISMLVALSDARFAEGGRDFAETHVRELIRRGERVFFVGHWGFQYYMEAEGGVPLDMTALFEQRSNLRTGDLLVRPHPAYSTNVDERLQIPSSFVLQQQYRNPYGFVTMNAVYGAGFYSVDWGPLPFNAAWNPVVNQFSLWRIAVPKLEIQSSIPPGG